MRIWGKTDQGVVSENNEDCFFASIINQSENIACAVVCDGMGGAAAGELASTYATEAFRAVAESALSESMPKTDLVSAINHAVSSANCKVVDISKSDSALTGMGTTLVAVMSIGNTVAIANIGDSRAYLLDENGIKQLTTDHSLVSELVRQGKLSPFEANKHPRKNVITRALGVDMEVECDTITAEVKKGDFIVLCSDGLTNEVSDPEIYYEIVETAMPQNACDALINIANSRGGHDNITIVIVSF